MLSERLQSVRTGTELFTTYAQSLEARVGSGALSREAALAELTETAMAMRFDGGINYVAGYAMGGTALRFPTAGSSAAIGCEAGSTVSAWPGC